MSIYVGPVVGVVVVVVVESEVVMLFDDGGNPSIRLPRLLL